MVYLHPRNLVVIGKLATLLINTTDVYKCGFLRLDHTGALTWVQVYTGSLQVIQVGV